MFITVKTRRFAARVFDKLGEMLWKHIFPAPIQMFNFELGTRNMEVTPSSISLGT
jgi:hypothetical protein